MTREEARKLVDGVYHVWWKRGGRSVASIGHNINGDAWIAPANWLSIDVYGLHWKTVERVELIFGASRYRAESEHA